MALPMSRPPPGPAANLQGHLAPPQLPAQVISRHQTSGKSLHCSASPPPVCIIKMKKTCPTLCGGRNKRQLSVMDCQKVQMLALLVMWGTQRLTSRLISWGTHALLVPYNEEIICRDPSQGDEEADPSAEWIRVKGENNHEEAGEGK